MKRLFCAVFAGLFLVLAGCDFTAVETSHRGDNRTAVTSSGHSSKPESEISSTSLPESAVSASSVVSSTPETINELPPFSPLEFSFLSGVGAWSTDLVLSPDGNFSGEFHDSDMGEVGDEYPNGVVYISVFEGRFANITKVNDYTYKMTLEFLQVDRLGEEWIEDGVKYISTEPYGLTGGTEFLFFYPETPIDELSEDFLSWWPCKYEQDESPKTTLSCHGIMNVTTKDGFFNYKCE